MKYTHTLSCIVLSMCFAVSVAWSPAARAADAADVGRPNIVLILADDLGMGDLGCYGQRQLKTPNIDRLAAEGMRFSSAYSGASVCAPSRCSLMTGRHMGHATVRGNWEVYPEGQAPLKQGEATVAMLLKQAGYATGICGKWGLGGPGSGSEPNNKGFDFFFGYNCQRHAHRYLTDHLYRNGERIDIEQKPGRRVYSQKLIAEESLKFIRENRQRPFFLFCAWTVPHGIWRIDQVPSVEAYADSGWSDAQKVYAAMVEGLDSDVGRVLETLKQLRIDRKTLVLFASDNGGVGAEIADRFGSHAGMRGAKGQLWEGGIRVPMLARWPGRVPAGRTCDWPTAFWDFLPTAAELAEAPLPPNVDGVSIVPALLGEEPPSRPPLYWEQIARNQVAKAVRVDHWKGHHPAPDQPIELYDLANDAAETTDVASEHPQAVARIEAIMAASRTEIEIPKPDPRVWEKYREDNQKLDAMLGWRETGGR
ncbi:MAG: arylsulfatase [Rhodopirellula sp.]|nr:arylsulfatase [Rhodopirellula sp.]